jgi:hypothetical protein
MMYTHVPSIDAFQAGKNLKIVELNGVTSEPTDMYDPKNSLFVASRKLMKEWKMAFEIGQVIRKQGVEPMPVMDLLRLVFGRKDSSVARKGEHRSAEMV